MKILIVSPYPILPPLHGSRVRTARLAEGLARAGAHVDVLCPWYPGQPRHAVVAETFTCHSHFLPSNLLPWAVPWLAAPLVLLSYQPPPRRRFVAFADYDVFQFEFCAHASWMTHVPDRTRVVYSAHNVERDYCANDRARHLLARASVRRIERLEAAAVARSDLVVTCTPDDVTRLRELYGTAARFAVVPHGCQAGFLALERQQLRAQSRARLGLRDDERAVLFVGGDASHNDEAVEFLVRNVLPQLDGHVRLLIAGRGRGRMRARVDGRVHFFGFVADLRPLLAAADVGVNPVRRACGASIKLLDYLAAGLAVVATPEGVRGFYGPMSGVRVLPPERFAEGISGPLGEELPDRAVLAGLTWEHLGRTLYQEYQRLCASPT